MPPPFPHTIILIGNYAPDEQESMLRFAAVMERELKKEGIDVRMIRPIPVLNRFAGTQSFLKKWIGYIDKFVIFPFVLRRLVRVSSQKTLFHICDHSNAMYGRHLKGHKWSITCHDLLAIQSALGEIPENPTRFSGRILQSWILGSFRKFTHVACVSQHTADQVMRLAQIPTSALRVIRMGLNDTFQPMLITERDEILDRLFKAKGMNCPARYLFHVGGNSWYKNRAGVIDIFSQIALVHSDIQLVFAGSHLPSELRAIVEMSGLGQRVSSLGQVSHQELNALYSGAEALLFPSFVEGFGWPLIEAQASGCPVIVSDRPPMNEITQDSAILIDASNARKSADTVLTYLSWPEEKKSNLIIKGLANSARFTTERMIREYLEFFQDVLSAK